MVKHTLGPSGLIRSIRTEYFICPKNSLMISIKEFSLAVTVSVLIEINRLCSLPHEVNITVEWRFSMRTESVTLSHECDIFVSRLEPSLNCDHNLMMVLDENQRHSK